MDAKQRTNLETLLDKAANAQDGAQAMNFAQAACNAANALRMLTDLDRVDKSAQDPERKAA